MTSANKLQISKQLIKRKKESFIRITACFIFDIFLDSASHFSETNVKQQETIQQLQRQIEELNEKLLISNQENVKCIFITSRYPMNDDVTRLDVQTQDKLLERIKKLETQNTVKDTDIKDLVKRIR